MFTFRTYLVIGIIYLVLFRLMMTILYKITYEDYHKKYVFKSYVVAIEYYIINYAVYLPIWPYVLVRYDIPELIYFIKDVFEEEA